MPTRWGSYSEICLPAATLLSAWLLFAALLSTGPLLASPPETVSAGADTSNPGDPINTPPSPIRPDATNSLEAGETIDGIDTYESVDQLRQNLGYVWHSLQAPVGGLQVIVHYLPGDEVWAQTILQSALTGVPALEKLTGVPLPIRYDIQFWEVRQADIGVAGKNAREEGILLSREVGDVVVHELAHYWVGSHDLAEHWMAEGLAELYDHMVQLQLQNRPWMSPSLPELQSLSPFDAPLALWQRLDHGDATVQQREVNRFFYSKAFLFWYGLQRAYGPLFFKDLQRWIMAGREPRDSTALLSFLEPLQKRGVPSIWDLYPGWLVEGSYGTREQNRTFEWYLGDDDDDGVSNLEELMSGLDPHNKDTDGDGLDDGWELYAGRNPARAEPRRASPDSTWVIPQWTPSSSRMFVRAGDTIQVHAEGYWRMSDRSGRWFGPDGAPGDTSRDGNWGELAAQVGWGPNAGRIQTIGRQATFVADRDGILYYFARGPRKRMGRGGLLVTAEGGHLLPALERADLKLERKPGRSLSRHNRLCRDLRSEGITELELNGRHVTVVLDPADVEEMADPEAALAYLDQVYEFYRDMVGDAPYGGRKVLINFDVTTRDRMQFFGNTLVLTFGLDHLRALQKLSRPNRGAWGLTYAMALPFLEWYQVDRILEGKAVWALAELMASQYYEKQGAEVPALEQARARLRSYQFTLRGPETMAADKRLTWTFMNSLRRDFGWSAFRSMLEANGTLRLLPSNVTPGDLNTSEVPFEEFLIGFARAAGVNLSDRYRAWGFPITGRLRQALDPLPVPESSPKPEETWTVPRPSHRG